VAERARDAAMSDAARRRTVSSFALKSWERLRRCLLALGSATRHAVRVALGDLLQDPRHAVVDSGRASPRLRVFGQRRVAEVGEELLVEAEELRQVAGVRLLVVEDRRVLTLRAFRQVGLRAGSRGCGCPGVGLSFHSGGFGPIGGLSGGCGSSRPPSGSFSNSPRLESFLIQ